MKDKKREVLSYVFGTIGILMFLLAAGFVMDRFATACICGLFAALFVSIGARIGGYMDE